MTKTPSEISSEVVLAEEGTPLAKFQKDRTDAISRMFDRDKMCGKIHTTSKFFVDLDNSVRKIILSQEVKILESTRVILMKVRDEVEKEHGSSNVYLDMMEELYNEEIDEEIKKIKS